ncbi:MAG: hypothetical protein HYZ53_13665 [Planctomycetes bacterium]|nr:hypothetical protein [Planctomycetota bacterium]
MVVTLSMVFASCLLSIVVINLNYAGMEKAHRTLDKFAAMLYPLTYAGLFALYVW